MLPIAFALALLTADPKPERIAVSDPAKLKGDADFATQGEYAAMANDALQVVALGGGKFRAKLFDGPLPGEQATAKAVLEIPGELVDGPSDSSRVTKCSSRSRPARLGHGTPTHGR